MRIETRAEWNVRLFSKSTDARCRKTYKKVKTSTIHCKPLATFQVKRILSGRKSHISEEISYQLFHLLFFTLASSLSPSFFPLFPPSRSLHIFYASGPIIAHSLYFHLVNSSLSDYFLSYQISADIE